MVVYLAFPMTGRSVGETREYVEETANELREMGFEVLSPLIGTECLTDEEILKTNYEDPVLSDKAIVRRDLWLLKKADIVLVDFGKAEKVSVGCVVETAWAYLLGKHVVSVLPKNSVHDHPFLREASDVIFGTLDEALEYLYFLIKNEGGMK